jgi:tripartite motif-containing protein 71
MLPATVGAQPPAYLTQRGSYGSGNGQFYSPGDVAVDHSGNVYVPDTSIDRIQKFTSDGTYLAKWGTQGSGNGRFDYPAGAAVDGSGNVYVADTYNQRIQVFGATVPTKSTSWGRIKGLYR